MTQYTDEQIAQQLEQLAIVIQAAKESANTVLQQIQATQDEISQFVEIKKTEIVNSQNQIVEQVQRQVQLQEGEIVNQFRTLVANTLTDLGGQAGLEKLRQELQEGHHVLSEIQIVNHQLHSGIETSLSKLQDMLQIHSAVKQTVSELEATRSEISDLALQIQSDKKSIQTMRVEVENFSNDIENTKNTLVMELRGEIKQLQRELQKQQIQAKSQQSLRNWLFGIAFSTAFIALVLAVR
jgi:chromosome segregation ATPase